MKKLTAPVAIFVLFVVGCGASQDAPTSRIYSVQLNPSVAKSADYSGEVTVGPEGKTAPIQIHWSVGPDDAGCLKIIDIHADRQASDPTLVVSGVKHSAESDCAMEWESTDETRFQAALISLEYVTTIGIKEHSFRGTVASIQGNGKFTDLTK